MDEKSVLDQYAEAIRSGGTSYTSTQEPEMHPDSIFFKEPTPPAPEPINKKKIAAYIVAGLLMLSLSAFFIYAALKPDPKNYIESTFFELHPDLIEIELEPIDEPTEAQYRLEQDLAIESLKASERLQMEAIRLYYATPIKRGYKRTLCITTGNVKKCSALSGREKVLEGLRRP